MYVITKMCACGRNYTYPSAMPDPVVCGVCMADLEDEGKDDS